MTANYLVTKKERPKLQRTPRVLRSLFVIVIAVGFTAAGLTAQQQTTVSTLVISVNIPTTVCSEQMTICGIESC